MGSKEKILVCLGVKIIKKIGFLKALKKIAEKTENEVDDMIVGSFDVGITLVEQYYCNSKPVEELTIDEE